MSHYAVVLDYVRLHPGKTSTEIMTGLHQDDLPAIERALAQLVKNGIVALTGTVPTGTYAHVSGRA